MYISKEINFKNGGKLKRYPQRCWRLKIIQATEIDIKQAQTDIMCNAIVAAIICSI